MLCGQIGVSCHIASFVCLPPDLKAYTYDLRLWLAVLGFLALLGLPFLIKMRAVVCARRRLQHTHFVLLLGCHLPSLALCSNPSCFVSRHKVESTATRTVHTEARPP